jgi:hypothetical protein
MPVNRTMTWDDIKAAASRQSGVLSSYARTFLAHLAPLPWDKVFEEASPVTLAASAVQQEVVRWPRNGTDNSAMLALVRGVAMGPASPTDWDNIVWQVLVDGAAVPGYDRIIGPFGVFVYPKPVLIPLLPDQVVSIVASNLTAAPIALVTAAVEGNYFPAILDQPASPGG